MHKKIKFYTLERFGVNDANELQSGVLDKLKTLTELFKDNASSSDLQTGPISSPTITGYASAGVPTFGPLKVVTSKFDLIELSQSDVDNGFTQCSNLPAIYADFLAQNTSGLTPSGIYFYAYPVYEDSDVENRDFYSILDDSVVTNSVATRNRSRLTIFASLDASYLIESSGERPIRLGSVNKEYIFGPTNTHGNTTTNTASPFLPSSFKPYVHFANIFDASGNYNDEDGGIANEANSRNDDVSQNLQNIEPGTRAPLKLTFDKIKRNFDRIKSFGENDPTDTDLLGPNDRPKYSLQGLKKIIENEISDLNTTINNNLTESLSEVRLYYAIKKEETNVFTTSKWTDPNIAGVGLYNNYEFYKNSAGSVANTAINDMTEAEALVTLRNLVISLPSAYTSKYIAGLSINLVVNNFDSEQFNENDYDLIFQIKQSPSFVRRIKDLDFIDDISVTREYVSHPHSTTYVAIDHTTQSVPAGIEIMLIPHELFRESATFNVVFEIKLLLKEYI